MTYSFIYSANFYYSNDRILLFMAPAHLTTLYLNVLPSILMPPCKLSTLMSPPCTRMYHPVLLGIPLYPTVRHQYARYTPFLYILIPLFCQVSHSYETFGGPHDAQINCSEYVSLLDHKIPLYSHIISCTPLNTASKKRSLFGVNFPFIIEVSNLIVSD